jgi:hypothetical protein
VNYGRWRSLKSRVRSKNLSQKLVILNTLARRALRISDDDNLVQEKDHLSRFLKIIGYKDKDIKKMINKSPDRESNGPKPPNNQPPDTTIYLPYIQGITDKIASVLRKKEIKTSFKPLETIKQKKKSVNDEPNHKKCKGVYKIEFSCGKCYIGETGHSFQIRIKEHGANIKTECTRTSSLAEHSFSSKHHISLEDTKILANKDHFFKHRIKEAIEILEHRNNLNRDNGLEISENWIPLIQDRCMS